MEIKINDTKTVNVPDKWEDLLLWQYLEYTNVIFPSKSDTEKEEYLESAEGFFKLTRLVEILCGEQEGGLDECTIDELNNLYSKLTPLIETIHSVNDKVTNFKTHFYINDVLYVCRNTKGLTELTQGEVISIKQMEEIYQNDTIKKVTMMLAILIRNGKEINDTEFGLRYEIDKFDRRDIMNMDKRAEIFLKNARASDVMPVLGFFLNTKERTPKNSQTFLKVI
jgi:hypothetical protein